MSDLLAQLGITPADLQERIIERAVEALLAENDLDEDGEVSQRPPDLSDRVRKMVTARIDAKIQQLADQYLLPKIDAHIDSLILQQTTAWGEKRGQPMSVVEYLVACAEAYMIEPVDHNGKTKTEDSYNWRQHSTRITHAIHKHLQFEIDRAMQDALKTANSTMAKGLHEACRIAINEAAQKFAIVAKGG